MRFHSSFHWSSELDYSGVHCDDLKLQIEDDQDEKSVSSEEEGIDPVAKKSQVASQNLHIELLRQNDDER